MSHLGLSSLVLFIISLQVASQVAALDIGYKAGVQNMTEKPKLLFLLGAVSRTFLHLFPKSVTKLHAPINY